MLVAGLLAGVITAGCRGGGDTTEPARTVFSPRDGDTIVVATGTPFTVRLPANASTEWSVDGQLGEVRLLDSTYVAPSPDRIGAAGYQLLRFQVDEPGTYDVTLAYSRPFAPGRAAKTRAFAVEAR